MRIFNSLIVPKNVKSGTLGFFNIHSGAKHQRNRKSHKAEKRGGKVL